MSLSDTLPSMLDVQRQGAVLHVTLNRPELRNALDETLIGALIEVFSGSFDGLRAVVLRGAGKAFCAGGDLNYMKRMGGFTREENLADATRLAGLFASIERCPVPVVAGIHGACFGGGCGLASAVDVAIAEVGTSFAFSEVRLGLIPATISPFVVRKIGAGAARSLFVTGESFGTDRAERIGLIAATTYSLDDGIAEVMGAILANAPEAMIAARNLALDGPLALDDCAARLADTRASAEAKEGIAAFLERRVPTYVSGTPE